MRVSVLSVFLATWMPSILGIEIEIYPESPVEGNTVILRVTNISDTFIFLNWYKGDNTNSDQQIIGLNAARERRNGSQIFPDADIFTNGSLKISSAKTNHSGDYTVSVQAAQLSHKTVKLTVTGGLPDWIIVLIVISSILGVGLLSGLGVFLYKKHSGKEASPP
ncbi:cell adhesion molecule CEACAM7-like isoform 3-T3 [Anomaloglossus baeobatrachus]|uniref:cell adhesion molecule CEACAM7-like isoform X3 n=1 Tax=Anomaloglossus baeobatrachus TaxID=238106 RepID=UPI003F4FBAE2